MSTPELEIVVDATFLHEVGYGRAWTAAVREVAAGALADPTVRLTTFADDGGAIYGGRFRAGSDEHRVRLVLHRIPQRRGALSGFVAADGTIWEIVETK